MGKFLLEGREKGRGREGQGLKNHKIPVFSVSVRLEPGTSWLPAGSLSQICYLINSKFSKIINVL
jgi:hypothetical protein